MKLPQFLVNLILIRSAITDHNESKMNCNPSNDDLPMEKRLIKDLLDNYQRVGVVGRPVKNSFQKVVVYYMLELVQILDLDEKNQVLTINVWARYNWTDELLIWNPNKYSNISKIRVPAEKIWTPDIVLYNYADERLKEHRNVMIVVESTGLVLWNPPAIFKSSCKIDITNFPFDQQICFLKFGSWTYDGNQLDIQFFNNQSEINTDVYTNSNEWKIIQKPGYRSQIFYTCCPEPYLDITFYLVLERNPAFFTYLLLLPCVLLSSLTLVIFWLPPESPAKMVLGMNIFVAFFLLLLLLADSTPSASTNVPYIGYYYCLNMILITMSTFCSVIVINLYFRGDNKSRVPSFLKKIILKIGFILLMDTSNIKESNDKIKIIKSEIKYNRKFCKKVGFKFGSDQSLQRYQLDHDANNGPGHFNSPDVNSTKQNVSQWNQYGNCISPTGKDCNPMYYEGNDKIGSIKYCLENNKITITEDINRYLGFEPDGYNSSVPVSPQLERTILKFSETLENDVAEIRKGIKTLMNRMADIDNANKRAGEWRTVALVLDRIFFWLFLSTIIVSGLILLLPKSPQSSLDDVIKKNQIQNNKTNS